MKILVLGTGCPKCKQLARNVEAAVSELGAEAAVEKITDLNDILSYGVMMTPAIAVDGVVKSAGRVSTVDEIKQMLS